MKTLIVVPARYKSKRFPGKPLKKILKKELIIRVLEGCKKLISNKIIRLQISITKRINGIWKNCLWMSNVKMYDI